MCCAATRLDPALRLVARQAGQRNRELDFAPEPVREGAALRVSCQAAAPARGERYAPITIYASSDAVS
ncbi:hypothetical protein NH8B_2762 [Pseudogulbenkiania sp. NH8B]|nr:hypothetical protein NH8B_2762 [Pseudogulbenkiania sp. NH8B]